MPDTTWTNCWCHYCLAGQKTNHSPPLHHYNHYNHHLVCRTGPFCMLLNQINNKNNSSNNSNSNNYYY